MRARTLPSGVRRTTWGCGRPQAILAATAALFAPPTRIGGVRKHGSRKRDTGGGGGGGATADDRCWADVYRSHPHTLDLAYGDATAGPGGRAALPHRRIRAMGTGTHRSGAVRTS